MLSLRADLNCEFNQLVPYIHKELFGKKGIPILKEITHVIDCECYRVDGKLFFREVSILGVIIDDIVNESSRLITRASNETFTDLSLIKTADDNWGKRKIIHSIKVNIEKNTYNDAISFSLVQVKRSMFTNSIPGSLVSNQANWSLNQLINTPQKNV